MSTSRKFSVLVLLVAFMVVFVVLRWPSGSPSTIREKQESDTARNRPQQIPSLQEGQVDRPSRNVSEDEKPSPSEPIEGRLGDILGDDSTLRSHERVEWLRAYGAELNDDEKGTLLAFVQSGKVPVGIGERDWHWIVDCLLTELRNGARDPIALTGELQNIFSTRSLDPVVRDYVLQHLGHLGHQGGDAGIVSSTALAGLAEIGTTIAGTALLVLHREPPLPGHAAPVTDNPDPGMLAMALINNQATSTPAKVTALQVAAQRDAEGITEAAAAFLKSDAPVMVKVAAVAAVAEAGSGSDLFILQELHADHPLLQRAVSAGVHKLAAKD